MEGKPIPGFKRYIQEYPIVDLGWKVLPWFQIDLDKLRAWYNNLEKEYSDWKFIYGDTRHVWVEDIGDPDGITGHKLMSNTAYYTLCWNSDEPGPKPFEQGQAKPEYKDDDNGELNPRKCFKGYALDIVTNLPIRSKKWLVTIHTPGTKLIDHQDSPDKIRVHIPIYTNDESKWIIDGEEFHMEPGWAYIVNTTLVHSLENKGTTDRIHLYGKVWTDDVQRLFS
jgi:hypothetical protein